MLHRPGILAEPGIRGCGHTETTRSGRRILPGGMSATGTARVASKLHSSETALAGVVLQVRSPEGKSARTPRRTAPPAATFGTQSPIRLPPGACRDTADCGHKHTVQLPPGGCFFADGPWPSRATAIRARIPEG